MGKINVVGDLLILVVILKMKFTFVLLLKPYLDRMWEIYENIPWNILNPT